jgi:hypothetical protein
MSGDTPATGQATTSNTQAAPATAAPTANWWHPHVGQAVVALVVPILLSVATIFGSLYVSSVQLQDRMAKVDERLKELADKKADGTVMENSINNLTATAGTKADGVATQNAINRDMTDITGLRNEVTMLGKVAAKLEAQANGQGDDFTHLKTVQMEKVQSDLAAIKERLATVEANLNVKARTHEGKEGDR